MIYKLLIILVAIFTWKAFGQDRNKTLDTSQVETIKETQIKIIQSSIQKQKRSQ